MAATMATARARSATTRPRFSLVLLGSAQLRDERTGTAVLFPAKGFELAAYLILEHDGAPVRRDVVSEHLWPDVERASAIVNLRSLLARIGRIRDRTGFDLVTTTRDHVGLTTPIAADIVRLRALAATTVSATSILDMCALYRGDLLDDSAGSAGAREWVASRRAALRDLLVGSLTQFLDMADAARDHSVIETASAKLLAIDPFQEAPYRALMRLHAAAGRPRDLERVYRDCCERFEAELGASPSPVVTKLYRTLCGLDPERDVGRRPAVSLPVEATPPRLSPVSNALPSICILMPPVQDTGSQFALLVALLEDVTIGLCAQRTFAVIAPFTAWQIGSDCEPGGFVDEFGIGYLLQSRVQKIGSDLFLTPRLIDARSRKIIWADRFAFDESSLHQTYHRLTWRIVRSLSEAVENAELDRHRRDAQSSAYVAYLLGTRSLSEAGLPNVRAARRLFKASLRQDDRFGLAFSAIARTLVMEWLLVARGEPALLEEAEYCARRALNLDPDHADGLRELGLCHLYRGRFDDSLHAFAEAEVGAPQHADLIADHADALSLAGMSSEALGKIRRAIALNPLCPDRYRWYEGTILYQLDQYEGAIGSVSRMADSSPANKLLAASWAMLGDSARAREYAHKVLQTYPDFTVDGWLSMIPIRDVALKERYEQGLRAAGFR